MDSQKQISAGTADLSLPKNCLCGALSRALRAVRKDYDAALRDSGVTSAQFSILTTLSIIGEVAISELAATMGTDRTTLTRNIAPLVKAGLVAELHHEDQRVRRLGLSDAGRKIHGDAVKGWRRAQDRLADTIGTEKAGTLVETLNAIH